MRVVDDDSGESVEEVPRYYVIIQLKKPIQYEKRCYSDMRSSIRESA